LSLNGIEELSDTQARYLSRFKGAFLSLYKLNSISDNGIKFLSLYGGDILINEALEGKISVCDQNVDGDILLIRCMRAMSPVVRKNLPMIDMENEEGSYCVCDDSSVDYDEENPYEF